MKKVTDQVKQQAIDLRVTERLSIDDISDRLGIAVGTVSPIVRPYPLTTEELLSRRKVGNRSQKPRGESCKFWEIASNLDRMSTGRVAEAAVLYRLAIYNVTVYRAVFDGDHSDFLVEVDDRFLKIQVKATRQNQAHGLPTLNITCREGSNYRPYKKSELDFLVGYDLRTDTAYVFSWAEINHLKTTATVKPEAAERWEKLLSG